MHKIMTVGVQKPETIMSQEQTLPLLTIYP